MDYSRLKRMIEETIPWVKESGLSAEVLEERHVILRLPEERSPEPRGDRLRWVALHADGNRRRRTVCLHL